MLMVDRSGGETGMFRENWGDTMVADALANRDARPSAAMLLTVQNIRAIVFYGEGFRRNISPKCGEMTESPNIN